MMEIAASGSKPWLGVSTVKNTPRVTKTSNSVTKALVIAASLEYESEAT